MKIHIKVAAITTLIWLFIAGMTALAVYSPIGFVVVVASLNMAIIVYSVYQVLYLELAWRELEKSLKK